MKLKQIIEACDYRVCDGSEYLWDSFGPNARYMQFSDQSEREHCSIVFDTKNQTVYEVTLYVPHGDLAFKWTHPDYRNAYLAECLAKNVRFNEAWDDVDYQMLDAETILQYAEDIGKLTYSNLPACEETQ